MSNSYYSHSDGVPASGTRGLSSLMRAEFDSVEDGFDVAQNYAVDTGTANAMIIAPPAALVALFDGLVFRIKAAATITGATTVNLGATLGTKDLKMQDGTAMSTQILANQIFECVWDATAGYLKFMSGGVPGASNGLPTTGGTMFGPINEAKGANIASAATINLTTATGNFVHVTGTTPITAITIPIGAERAVVFDGILTLTHSASLLCPGAANITTAANDRMIVRGDTAGAVVISYIRASGLPVVLQDLGVVLANPAGATLIGYAYNAIMANASYTLPDLTAATTTASFGVVVPSNASAVPSTLTTSDSWSIATGFSAGTLKAIAPINRATAHGVWGSATQTPPTLASVTAAGAPTILGSVQLNANAIVFLYIVSTTAYAVALNPVTGSFGAAVSLGSYTAASIGNAIYADTSSTFAAFVNFTTAYAIAGSVSGVTITLGSAQNLAGAVKMMETPIQLQAGQYLASVNQTSNLIPVSVSGTVCTAGTAVADGNSVGGANTGNSRIEKVSSTTALVVYATSTAPTSLTARVASVSANAITMNTAATSGTSPLAANSTQINLCKAFASGGPFLVCGTDNAVGTTGDWYGITVSGTTPTIGTVSAQVTNLPAAANSYRQTFVSTPSTAATAAIAPYNSSTMLLGHLSAGPIAATITGTTLAFGSALALGATTKFVNDVATGANFYAVTSTTVDKITVSGTAITSSYQLAVAPVIVSSDTLNDKSVSYSSTWYSWTLATMTAAVSASKWVYISGSNIIYTGPIT